MLEPISSENNGSAVIVRRNLQQLRSLRLGKDSGIILKNRLITNQRLTKKRRPEVRKRRMIGTESAFFCEQRPVHQSAPLEKSLSLALVVFFAESMRKAN